mmetsp:Transcript_9515/g.24247  ORF Transcript_9515/g.24247 Transcript_9515/m.24247 type:complete len:546 (+) Transcript_9515:221-1858(+)
MTSEPMTPPRAPLHHPTTPGTCRSGLSVKNTFIEYSDSDSDSEDIIFARSWPSTKRGGDVTASLVAQYAAMKPTLEVSSARTSEAETDAVAQASAAGSTDFGGVSSRVSEAGTEGQEAETRGTSAWVRAGQPSLIIPESPQHAGGEAQAQEVYSQQHQLLALLQHQQQVQNHQLQQLLAIQTRDQLVARLQAEQGEYAEAGEVPGGNAALAAAQLAQLAQQGDQQALVLLQLLCQAESPGAGAPARAAGGRTAERVVPMGSPGHTAQRVRPPAPVVLGTPSRPTRISLAVSAAASPKSCASPTRTAMRVLPVREVVPAATPVRARAPVTPQAPAEEPVEEPVELERPEEPVVAEEEPASPRGSGSESGSEVEDDQVRRCREGLDPLPSVGSVGHFDGTCKRCCFHPKGRCENGADCHFCHFDHERKKRTSKKKKLARRRRRQDEDDCQYKMNSYASYQPVHGPALVQQVAQHHADQLHQLQLQQQQLELQHLQLHQLELQRRQLEERLQAGDAGAQAWAAPVVTMEQLQEMQSQGMVVMMAQASP